MLEGAAAALAACETVVFARRIVTRTRHAGEAHDTIDAQRFMALTRVEGDAPFALYWSAHGLGYAIPDDMIRDIEAGRTVVTNVSRTVIAQARQRFSNVRVVLVDAPLGVRRQRILSRGRETGEQIDDRLARRVDQFDRADADHIVMNDRSLDEGIRQMVAAIAD